MDHAFAFLGEIYGWGGLGQKKYGGKSGEGNEPDFKR